MDLQLVKTIINQRADIGLRYAMVPLANITASVRNTLTEEGYRIFWPNSNNVCMVTW